MTIVEIADDVNRVGARPQGWSGSCLALLLPTNIIRPLIEIPVLEDITQLFISSRATLRLMRVDLNWGILLSSSEATTRITTLKEWIALKPIKDPVVLGVVSGLIGNAAKMLGDEISLRMKISQRSFRETSAGVWVNKRSEATKLRGQLLGAISDFGMSGVFGIALVQIISKTGKSGLLLKGVTAGMSFGAFITAILSMQPDNKVRPKDAASNLSYMVNHAILGIVSTTVAVKLGAPSLFDNKSAKGIAVVVAPSETTSVIEIPNVQALT